MLELAPPAAATGLMDGEDFEGMPLDAFIDEVMALIEYGAAPKILVQNVQPLRWAERDANHQQILEMMSSHEH